MSDFSRKRSPAVAGQFYSGTPEHLQAAVERALKAPQVSFAAERVRGLIVPHAGYQFSGATAGRAYALLRGRDDVKRVVVLAPSHRAFLMGVSVGDYSAFSTPLGDVAVDVPVCRELLEANALVSSRRDVHASEHSLEVQLPFIQTVLPEAKLVPVVCGEMSTEDLHSVAATFADGLLRPDTVWIVSTDFTHYGHSFGYVPFIDEVPKRLEELDMGAVQQVLKIDSGEFLDYVNRTGATICGRLPVALLLAALEHADGAYCCELLDYTTSGQLTRDFSHSVSYVSIAVAGPPAAAASNASATQEQDSLMSAADKAELLRLARAAIASSLGDAETSVPSDAEMSAALNADGACFVTLHLDGALRGCIGSLEAEVPLYRDVMDNACNAAFTDYRFSPVTQEELSRIDIEISVLTPSVPIDSPDEFIVGEHGIILEKGRYRAVFLPQVAPQQGWDRETTLTHLALKAGLKSTDWRYGASFSVFKAVVFGEKD